MDNIDLVKLARAFKNNTMSQVEAYGKIVKRVKAPTNINPNTKKRDGGMFVQMDLFAVRLSKYSQYLKDNGYYSDNDLYMVNGSIVTYIPKDTKNLPDWFKIYGTLAIGRHEDDNIMSIFKWIKHNGSWALDLMYLDDLETSDFEKNEIINIWLNKSIQSDKVEHPDYVNNLTEFHAVNKIFNEQKPATIEVVEDKNTIQANTKVYSSIVGNFVKESRENIKPFSPVYDNYYNILKTSEELRKGYIDKLRQDFELDGISQYIEHTVKSLLSHLKTKPEGQAMTGRAILKIYLSKFGKLATANYLGTTTSNFLIDDFAEVAEFILNSNNVSCTDEAWKLCKEAFANPELFYAGIISSFLNIDYNTITDIAQICYDNDISFSTLINENPYALQLMDNLSYNTIDYIALCFGKTSDKNLEKDRGIAIVHSYIMDRDNGSTLFDITKLMNNKLGSKITANRYDTCRVKGTYLTDSNVANIKAYIGDKDTKYDTTGFIKSGGYNYIKLLKPVELNIAIESYLQSGLGVKFSNYITSSYLLEKELFVYNTMYNMGMDKRGLNHAEINKWIDKYEQEEVGFILEPEQRKAVHLIDNRAAVIAGSAGSGKTTISNCMVYVLKNMLPDCDIRFSAPTGKAAKRMQEVVKDEVKTLNSRFKVFSANSGIFNNEDNNIVGDDYDVINMFDEGAMITIDLMFSVLKRFNSDDSLYLFGDFHQLSPIGKGLPFRNFLRFMPCQFLNVSKRAATGSKITYNSDLVNNFSEGNNWKNLESGEDFIIVPCNQDDISNCVKDICSYYLGYKGEDELKRKWGIKSLPDVEKLTEDDIQVVSPLTKATYTWGATRLNTMLEPLFNKTRDYSKTFVYQTNEKNYTKFVIDDRVIHSDSNMYSMQWYASFNKSGDTTIFKKRYGFGICNGEVGKIVGFVPTYNCEFDNEDVSTKPADFEYYRNMRDDSRYSEDGAYFVIVEYFDYLSQSNFYILYRAKITKFESQIGLSLNGDDLAKLNLFYAGTTHKLQGSQAKLIISVLGNINFKGFITRNMVYTMMTRAEKLEFLVGSVTNDFNSMLSNARRDIASLDTLTVGEVL